SRHPSVPLSSPPPAPPPTHSRSLHDALPISSSFCLPGTSSLGISTPRSPRATMIASDSWMMSSMRSSAAGFSILDMIPARPLIRSEEHTSELQSHLNLVCRLLLEKKKDTE